MMCSEAALPIQRLATSRAPTIVIDGIQKVRHADGYATVVKHLTRPDIPSITYFTKITHFTC
jgi:hypothetical protein